MLQLASSLLLLVLLLGEDRGRQSASLLTVHSLEKELESREGSLCLNEDAFRSTLVAADAYFLSLLFSGTLIFYPWLLNVTIFTLFSYFRHLVFL